MRPLVLFFLFSSTAAVAAEPPVAGRWSGEVRVPGQPVGVVVDLAVGSEGRWVGSITSAAWVVKGAPLAKLAVTPSGAAFSLENALGASPDGIATFQATLLGRDTLQGSFSQGGHSAPFVLHRAGIAQVEEPPRSTPVRAEVVGTWRGDYELDGYTHHVTLKFANPPGKPAAVGFLLVGKQPHTLTVDFVADEEGLLSVECAELGVRFEGRLQADGAELAGVVGQGPEEAAIVLHRDTGATS